jgi:type IV pilus assembly protein PilQ
MADGGAHLYRLFRDIAMHHLKTRIFKIIIAICIASILLVAQAAPVVSHVKPTQPLSLHFKEIPVRDVLGLLAQSAGMNLLLSETVQGNITLELDQITWQQALDTVLHMQGLSARREGNILSIAAATEMTERESQRMAAEPLQTAFIVVHYAKAEELSALLQNKNDTLLSTRGSVMVDVRTNQLWIKDTPDRLIKVRQFLHGVDVPVKQVQIAARIVNIDASYVEELGLKFSTLSNKTAGVGNNDALHMDMPLQMQNAGHFTMAIAKLGEGALFDLEISALEREGHARIISRPQLITANHQPAAIESGQEIPYQEKTSSGATNVAFKKAVLSLKVTPEITPENKILLSLIVNQDKVDSLQINGVPVINTQQVQSQILLNNKETIVLGGIYEQSSSNVVERIPFWGNIPLLGKLLSNKETHTERKELLVFITPQIIA